MNNTTKIQTIDSKDLQSITGGTVCHGHSTEIVPSMTIQTAPIDPIPSYTITTPPVRYNNCK